jgi:hypothetical protein
MMPTLLIAVLSLVQPAPGETATPVDTIEVTDPVVLSSDLPLTPHSEPHLSINPNNPDELLVGTVVFPDSSKHRVDVLRSTNQGQSWEREQLPIADSISSIDPWTGFDRQGNSIVSVLAPTTAHEGDTALGFELFRKPSSDEEWKRSYTHVIDPDRGWSLDQPKLAVDQSRESKYTNRIYVSAHRWGDETGAGRSRHTAAFTYSSDSGESFSEMAHVSEDNLKDNALNPVVLSDGTMIGGTYNYLTIDTHKFQHLTWTFASSDGGRSHESLNFVTSKSIDLPLLAADTTSSGYQDRIYMASVVSDPDTMLAVLHSDSRGQRWSDPKKVAEVATKDKRITHYAAVDGEGRIGIVWTQKVRQSENEQCYRVHFSYSEDGGDTFTTDVTSENRTYCARIPGTPRMMTMAGEYRPVNRRFGKGGEYLGLVGMPDGGFYAVWVETEDGTLHLNGSRITIPADR